MKDFFNKEIIESNIEKCKISISTFEAEEQRERDIIRSYQEMIDNGDTTFPKESLERGIESAKGKIKIFQDAIDRERQTINMLYSQIGHNQKQAALEEEKVHHIKVIRE